MSSGQVMNRFEQRKISKNLIAIRKAIHKDVDKITDKLVARKVFTKQMRQDISNVCPSIPQLQCGVFINKLLRSGPTAYKVFRDVLLEMGHRSLVDVMEKTVSSCSAITDWNKTRDKTFVVSCRDNQDHIEDDGQVLDNRTSSQAHIEKIDDVQQLERMVTIVLDSLDETDKNNNSSKAFKNDFRQKLLLESKGNDELLGFFKTLSYNRLSIASHS